MTKKIDLLNKDKKNTKNKAKSMPKKSVSGSKTTKKTTQAPNHIPKRRGRRPKKILDNMDNTSVNSIEESIEPKNNSAVILRLNIDPSKLNIKKNTETKKNTENEKHKQTSSSRAKKASKEAPKKAPKEAPKKAPKKAPKVAVKKKNTINEDNTDESSEGMFTNDIPDDNICRKCVTNEKLLTQLKSKLEKYENKDKLDKSTKIHSNKLNLISAISGKKITIKKTHIWCWWDCHPFNNLPCFLVDSYHNDTYYVIGCFCSYNCSLAYNLYYMKDSKIYQRKSLTLRLYREMYGLSMEDSIDIKEAPPRENLDVFGGDKTIDAYRRSFVFVNKEYIVFIPPIKPITMIIEERNIDAVDDDGKDYVIKRSKPLSKKRSVISSMRMGNRDESS